LRTHPAGRLAREIREYLFHHTVFNFGHTPLRLALTPAALNAPITVESLCVGVAVFPGGRSVAKILVADDNSNIQKMVGLALRDHGIDVIAVGNGEAAVRKIVDLRPDLVLADVFMPVRNGYEVCKFVKDDSSLAHIPVILLVGAFDPLDEQEAQRVGADGVLKKPFVPPDPLISMVKSALARASSGHVAVSATAGKVAVPATPAVANPNATVVSHSAPTVVAAPEQVAQTQALVEDIPTRPEAVKIDSSNQPLAFGSLLSNPVAEPEEAAYVAPVNPELADRNFSAPEIEEEEEEGEDSGSGAWRRDGGGAAFGDTVEAAAEKPTARAKRREGWSPTREKTQDLLESAVEPEFVSAPPLEIKKSAPAAVALEDSWKKAAKQEPEIKAGPVETAPVLQAASPSVSPFEIPPMPILSSPGVATTEAPAPQTAAPGNPNSWFSTTASPWEAEAQKASQLASSWDAPAKPAEIAPLETAPVETAPVKSEEPEAVAQELAVEEPAPTYDFVSEAPSEEPVHYVPDPALVGNEPVSNDTLPDLLSDGLIPAEAVESLRQQTSYAVESAVQQAAEEPADSAVQGASATPDMDALVAKVLAKMSPEMLQAVTREILKPVVEAMVRDEISSKKS
jgi:CheY-like chemotaxis protein